MSSVPHHANVPGFDQHSATTWNVATLSAVRTGYGEPDQSQGRLSGWWIVPSVILGLGIWVVIIRAALAWLA